MPRVARKPMKLTAENVVAVTKDCLYTDEEIQQIGLDNIESKALMVEGVVSKFGFNPVKIEKHRKDIRDMCECLPEEFMQNSEAGGHTFLRACVDKDGVQWGEQRTVDNLICLGLATGDIQFLIKDRTMWQILPGGVPYFYVTEEYKDESSDN